MNRIIYTATDPAGGRHTKTSETAAFTHVVMILPKFERYLERAEKMAPTPALAIERQATVQRQLEDGYFARWQHMGWCTSAEAADALAAQQRASGEYADVRVIETTFERT